MGPKAKWRTQMLTPQNNKLLIKDVLLAIPVYNESRYVDDILTAVSTYNSNILVVDDGSEDDTCKLLNKYESIKTITHKTNEGYGQSLIDAFEFAKSECYDWIITMDCDHQHQPACISRFLREIKKDNVDIISGSRYLLSTNPKNVPADRLRINRCITAMLNSVLRIDITDAFCGFKDSHTPPERLKILKTGFDFFSA